MDDGSRQKGKSDLNGARPASPGANSALSEKARDEAPEFLAVEMAVVFRRGKAAGVRKRDAIENIGLFRLHLFRIHGENMIGHGAFTIDGGNGVYREKALLGRIGVECIDVAFISPGLAEAFGDSFLSLERQMSLREGRGRTIHPPRVRLDFNEPPEHSEVNRLRRRIGSGQVIGKGGKDRGDSENQKQKRPRAQSGQPFPPRRFFLAQDKPERSGGGQGENDAARRNSKRQKRSEKRHYK